MAVRFDATGEHYTRSNSGPSTWSAVMWAYPISDTDHGPFAFGAANAGGNAVFVSRFGGANTLKCFDLNNHGGGFGSFVYSLNTWFCMAVTVNGANCSWYHGSAADAMTVDSVTNITSPTGGTQNWFVGIDSFDGQWWRGRVAAVKVWTAELTAAEVALEAAQYHPLRVANLVQWHPFLRAETVDYSGNGSTLTGGTNASTEDGPPIPWRVTTPRLVLPIAAGGATHEASATLTATETITAALEVTQLATATVSPSATVTADTTADKPATAASTVTAAITSVTAASKPVEATLPVAAGINAAAESAKSATATVASTVAVTGASFIDKLLSSTHDVSVATSASATTTKTLAASLAAAATVTADAVVGAAPVLAEASLDLTATITAVAERATPAGGTLTSTAAITAAAAVDKFASGSLTVTTALAVTTLAEKAGGASVAITATATATAVGAVTVPWPPTAGTPRVAGMYTATTPAVAGMYVGDPPVIQLP